MYNYTLFLMLSVLGNPYLGMDTVLMLTLILIWSKQIHITNIELKVLQLASMRFQLEVNISTMLFKTFA